MIELLSIAILNYPGALQSAVYGLADILTHAQRVSGRPLRLEVLDGFAETSGPYAAVILPPSA